MRRDVFQAIADPNRRAIIHLLAGQSLTHKEVAENFNVTRPAISKHLRILEECGLIEIKKQGREKYCHARPQQLQEAADWIEQFRVFWTKKLDALGEFLANETSSTPMDQPLKKTKRK